MILSPKKVKENLLLGSNFANYLAIWLTYSQCFGSQPAGQYMVPGTYRAYGYPLFFME